MADRDREDSASAPTKAERRVTPSGESTSIEPVEPRGSEPARVPERFEERGELGRGGMGRVVEAYDHSLGRTVAIKQVLAVSDVALARFEREAQITARLEHPGIVPVHDIGRGDDGTPYYVMKRIDGDPLQDLVRDKPFAERIRVVPNVLAACDACAYAHAHGVIHRDIKPSNILVGAFGETLLIDWGIARTIGEGDESTDMRPSAPSLTVAGAVAGTPGYMAPEQARGEKLDARADVFALGVTLFTVLAGKSPFAASSATEMVDHVGANRPADWSRIPDETPPELVAILKKAMAAERDSRYPDAGALAADLRSYVTGQLVGAYEYGAWDQLRRFGRKHRAALAVAVVALALIAVVAVISVRRIVSERDDARTARTLADLERQAALDKSDELLVQNALELAPDDPVAAIATLRRLRPDSKQWGRAAIASTVAMFHGIPHGFTIAESGSAAVAVSPDGAWVAAMPWKAGTLELVEVATNRRTTVPMAEVVATLAWADARTLAISYDTTLQLLDASTRAKRELRLPDPVATIEADDGAAIWIHTKAGQLFRVTASATSIGAPILDEVAEYAPGGRGRVAIGSKRGLELWGDGTLTPVRAEKPDTISGGGGRIAAQYGDEVCTWLLDDLAKPQPCIRVDPMSSVMGVSRSTVLVYSPSGLSLYHQSTRVQRHQGVGTVRRLPTGFAYAIPGAGLHVVANGLQTSLSQRHTEYSRIDVSPDGRILAAVTRRGVLLVWDLAPLQPRSVPIPSAERFVGTFGRHLVFERDDDTLVRFDPATGSRWTVAHPQGTTVAMQGSLGWVLILDPPGYVDRSLGVRMDRPIIRAAVHLATGVVHRFLPQEAALVSDRGVWTLRDGKISEVRPDGERRVLLTVDGATAAATFADVVAVLVGDRRICRVVLPATAPTCVTVTADVSDLAVDARGDVWILHGTISRWRPGTASVEAVFPEIGFTYLRQFGQDVIATGKQVILPLGHEPLTLIPLAGSQQLVAADRDRALVVENGLLSVIDLRERQVYGLPLYSQAQNTVAIDGTRLAVSRGTNVELFELSVPRDPVALRAWLESVTNAKPIAGSDAVEWP